jgi:hypothetical protein
MPIRKPDGLLPRRDYKYKGDNHILILKFYTLCYDLVNTTTSMDADSETKEPLSAKSPTWDWTQVLPDTEHVRFLKSVDWSKTYVGPITAWPPALRQATYQVIADSRPATLYWYDGCRSVMVCLSV